MLLSSDLNDQSKGLVLTRPAEPTYAITMMSLIAQLHHVRLALRGRLYSSTKSIDSRQADPQFGRYTNGSQHYFYAGTDSLKIIRSLARLFEVEGQAIFMKRAKKSNTRSTKKANKRTSMGSHKDTTVRNISGRDYLTLAALIFRDEEASNAWSADTSVSEKRRKIIDRFIPAHLLAAWRKAQRRTLAAREKLDTLLSAKPRKARLASFAEQDSVEVVTDLQSVDPLVDQEEALLIDSKKNKRHILLDQYERCAHEEGRLYGQIWQLIGEAAERSSKKKGVRPEHSIYLEGVIKRMLKDRFRDDPTECSFNDYKLAKLIEIDLNKNLASAFVREDHPWGKIRRYIAAIRKQNAETMIRPA